MIGGAMASVSPRRLKIRERDERILETAREMFVRDGFYGTTMARISGASKCPIGTVYQHFSCKEDLLLALAARAHKKRLEMVQRGASFPGRPRERMAYAGEAMVLFGRLYPGESQIIHNAGGPTLHEKTDPTWTEAFLRAQSDYLAFVKDLVQDGVHRGDLVLDDGTTVGEITCAIGAFAEGGFSYTEGGVPQRALGLTNPLDELWFAFNRLLDAYNWRPLFSEVDWHELLAELRRTVFPGEAQRAYGEEWWYGEYRLDPRAKLRTGDSED